MFKFLRSKKGFTIVELLIVLVLLSLGAVALINLVQVAYRSYNKSEERYIKQEAVKNVVELLQKHTKVQSAQTADVFDNPAIVPTGTASDESYSYLWAELKDLDGDGVREGYYLYMLNAGQTRKKTDDDGNVVQQTITSKNGATQTVDVENAKLISNVPLYVKMEPYITTEENGTETVRPAVKITVAALDSSVKYEDESGNAIVPSSDEIFYSLDVTYHFPNIVLNPDSHTTVNYNSGTLAAANTYDDNGNVNGYVNAVDGTGFVLRVYIDSILDGDNTSSDIAIPSLCFIATASYGQDSGEVGLLCDFRDNVLMQNALGRAFVKGYYTVSPPIAKVIAKSEPLAAAVRLALKPLIVVATYALDTELLAENMLYIVTFFACGISASAIAVGYSKKRRKSKN